MNRTPSAPQPQHSQLAAWCVHLYTASGALCAAATIQAIWNEQFQLAFGIMMLAVIIDATDGTLARWVDVKRVLPSIDGGKLDDIVDFLNYTFCPVLLIVQADWFPHPQLLWAAFPLVGSLFAFAHSEAKEESRGFFRGFPSYWNIVALYIGVWLHEYGHAVVLSVILALSLLSVLPVRFVYPNRPPCWRLLFLGGGFLWALTVLAMVATYPTPPTWLRVVSLIYPAFYTVSSIWLDRAIP